MPTASALYRFLLVRRLYLLEVGVAVLLLVLAPEPEGKLDSLQREQVLVVWQVFGAVIVVGLLIQDRWPLSALVLTGVGAAAHAIARDQDGPQIGFPTLIDLAVPITLYILTSRGRSRRLSMAALAVLMVAEIALGLSHLPSVPSEGKGSANSSQLDTRALDESIRYTELRNKVVGEGLTVLLALALAYAFGEATRSRRAHLKTLEQRAADLEREQRQRVALATAAERARIARELHDIVAHRVTGMVLQASAARAVMDSRPEQAVQALHTVEAGGRQAMAELRELLGLLASAQPEAPLTPTQGIAALPALVAGAGLPVRLTVTGDGDTLSRSVDLAAYRIIQEALTNASRHSTGTGTAVDVRVEDDAMYIDVTDDDAAPPAPAGTNGRGLLGMRQRVDSYAGTLTVGPLPDGRWQVHATVPTRPDPVEDPE